VGAVEPVITVGFQQWLIASCEGQGVAVKVGDPGVIRSIVVLLGGWVESDRARSRSTRRADTSVPSQQPVGLDAIDVQGSGPVGSGQDHDVIDHGSDDRGLPVQVQGGPLGA